MASWTPLSSAVRYTRGKLALREDAGRLPDGSEQVYPVLVAGIAVGILPFVEPDRVLLVRQYRHLVRGASWEVPGGGALPGEAGYRAARMEPDPLRADEDEFFERAVLPLDEVVAVLQYALRARRSRA